MCDFTRCAQAGSTFHKYPCSSLSSSLFKPVTRISSETHPAGWGWAPLPGRPGTLTRPGLGPWAPPGPPALDPGACSSPPLLCLNPAESSALPPRSPVLGLMDPLCPLQVQWTGWLELPCGRALGHPLPTPLLGHSSATAPLPAGSWGADSTGSRVRKLRSHPSASTF